MKTYRTKVLALGAGLALGMAATAGSAQSQSQTVTIGFVAPMTGAVANDGKDIERGAQLAIEDYNKKGITIAGRPVVLRLDSEDDQADPRVATQVAQHLADSNAVAVVGHYNSGTSIPASKIYSDAGMLQISPSATNPIYTQQGFKTAYRLVTTDAKQAPALATFATKQLNAKKIAIIDDATAYGQGLANEFQKSVAQDGAKVISHDATSDKAVDFRAILTKIKAQDPDIVMYGGEDATAGPMIRQASQLNIRAKFLVGDGACTPNLARLAGPAVDRVYCSVPGLPIEKMSGGAEFEKRYEARYKEPLQVYAPFAYDAVAVIVDAMVRANSTERAKILAAVPATQHDGLTGHIAFDERGDLKTAVITIYGYKGGKKDFISLVQF